MNRRLNIKIATVLGLVVLLLVPLGMIRGLVDERAQRRDETVTGIVDSFSREQLLAGPLIVVPWQRTVRDTATAQGNGEKRVVERIESGRLHFLPERFAFDARLATEVRERGIYRALLYRTQGTLKGSFHVPADFGLGSEAARYRFGTPWIAIGVGDIRGIGNVPELRINGRSLPFRPGTLTPPLREGIHAPLDGVDVAGSTLEFEVGLTLAGSRSLRVVPVGRETTATLTGDWPHPGFGGNLLPVDRTVRGDGFDARWSTSFFATDMEKVLRDCVAEPDCTGFRGKAFGVELVDPVDQYLKSERALKYALLFVGLAFAGFFLFEVLKRVDLNPVQYTLVGLALAVFYLLLLSLSEHIGFAAAYAVSATACVALIGSYVGAILGGARRGAGFAGALAGLYALLYGLLGSEDYALLMGSVLVFALLAAVMIFTRRVDWNATGAP